MILQTKDRLPVWLWLGLPLLFLLFIIIIIGFFPKQIKFVIEQENGVVELGTTLILIPAIYAGIRCFLCRQYLPVKWLATWLVLVTLGCVYIAGEEISWGQHLLEWNTPEYLQKINDQHETNIHNISSWFDQKPRLLLEIAILFGGIVMVLWNSFRHVEYRIDDWRLWFWPDVACFPSAVIAIFIRFPERYQSITGDWPLPFYVRFSEVQELYFAIFLFMYLYGNYHRLKQVKRRHGPI